MNSKKRGIAKLFSYVIVIALLAAVALGAFGNKAGSARGIKRGLDLAGGVSITYETVKAKPTATEMADTIEKMRLRAEIFSTESEVYQEGLNRVVVDIPDVKDADAVLKQLGSAGSIQFIPVEGNITRQADGTYKLNKTLEELAKEKKIAVDGADVATAKAQSVKGDAGVGVEYIVELELNAKGANKFAKATEENLHKQIAIVYDGNIISAPVVQTVITEGKAQISGQSSMEEAERLASIIRVGALPLELKEVRSSVVGAKLGDTALETSLLAGLIGFAIVFLFMIVMYKIPGLASSLALVAYVVIELVLLQLLQITLTLPGIAGIVLSVGMAVDANVIIFTRIKEEIGLGKSVRSAIGNGFKKALSAIIDGNITTIIAAIVLGIFGTGTIKGFAYTLALGIIISMFTALFITKFLLYSLYDIGFDSEKHYGTKVDKENKSFLKFAPKAYVLSLVVIGIGIATMIFNAVKGNGAFDYALEFSGGTSTEVVFDNGKVPGNDEIRGFVNGIISSSNADVTQIVGEDAVVIKTKSLSEDERTKLREQFVEKYKVSKDNITNENISGAVSGEMKRSALMSVIAATICMLIYIIIRFRNIAFGASAVLALIHDVLVVATLYALIRMNVGNTFIACMLTIVGYSINATIIIFDRIRENMAERKRGETVAEIVDKSITQTFSRSINTTVTTLIMVVVLFIMGVSSVREFSLPIIVGLICGAYSSICITGTLWYFIVRKKIEK